MQNPKEKARQMILNFDEEVVWSSVDHYIDRDFKLKTSGRVVGVKSTLVLRGRR